MLKKFLIYCGTSLMLAVTLSACRNHPEPTARQWQAWSAIHRSSEFGHSMNIKSRILVGALEGNLRRILLDKGCTRSRVYASDRLFHPVYRQYVESVGRRWLLDRPSADVFSNTALLYALEQVSDSDYQDSMYRLSDPKLAEPRTISDIFTKLNWFFSDELGDPGADDLVYRKLAMLTAFKEGLENTSHSDHFGRAMRAIDNETAETFKALPLSLSAPVDTKWIELAGWFSGTEKRDRLYAAMLEEMPAETVAAVVHYQESPLLTHMGDAYEAVSGWQTRVAQDQPVTTAQETLGRDIAEKYFGESLDTEIAQYLLHAHKVHLANLAHIYIGTHYRDLCGTPSSTIEWGRRAKTSRITTPFRPDAAIGRWDLPTAG